MTSGRRVSTILVAAVVAWAMAAPHLATANTGFKQTLLLPRAPVPTVHWLALPYLYSPLDVGLPGTIDAEDLCRDLGPGGVEAVVAWDDATSTFIEHLCGAADPFALTQGIGYGIRVVADWGLEATLSGGHDDGFVYTLPAGPGGQLTWLSVPYHLRIPPSRGASPVTAEELCRQIGSAEVLAIVRWDPEVAGYEAYGCGSVFEAPFEVVRGRSYGVVNRPGATITWQPIHF